MKQAAFESSQPQFNRALLVQQLWQSTLTQEETLSRTGMGGAGEELYSYRSFLMKSGHGSSFLCVFTSDSITAVLQTSAEFRKWGNKGIKTERLKSAVCFQVVISSVNQQRSISIFHCWMFKYISSFRSVSHLQLGFRLSIRELTWKEILSIYV